jgi:hypothetical protein
LFSNPNHRGGENQVGVLEIFVGRPASGPDLAFMVRMRNKRVCKNGRAGPAIVHTIGSGPVDFRVESAAQGACCLIVSRAAYIES